MIRLRWSEYIDCYQKKKYILKMYREPTYNGIQLGGIFDEKDNIKALELCNKFGIDATFEPFQEWI